MGLVGQDLHSPGVGQLHDGLNIRADPVVGGVVHKYGHSIRVVLDGLADLVHLHPQGDPQLLVHIRVHVDRNGSAEHHGVDDAFMDIPGKDDLIPLPRQTERIMV